jgi:hypothetical protein
MCIECPVFSVDLPLADLTKMGCEAAGALETNPRVTKNQIWNWWLQEEREEEEREQFGTFVKTCFQNRREICTLYQWNPGSLDEMEELEKEIL